MILSHKPIYEHIASYLDPITYYNLRVASPKHASLHPTLYAFVTFRIFRELARYFNSEAIAEIIMRHVNAPNSPYVITGSFLLKVLRGDTWECNDVDIAVVTELSNIDFIRHCSLISELYATKYGTHYLDYKEVNYCVDISVNNRNIQLLAHFHMEKILSNIKSFDLRFAQNAYGANHFIGINHPAHVSGARDEINIDEMYFLKHDPSGATSNYVYAVYAPRILERLKKYHERGFQMAISVENANKYTNYAWSEWKRYWREHEEGREFHQ